MSPEIIRRDLHFAEKSNIIVKLTQESGMTSLVPGVQREKKRICLWRSRLVGRGRTTGNRVGVKSVSRVRIPPSPPKEEPLMNGLFTPFVSGSFIFRTPAIEPEIP